jgi:hypothetical protein
MVDSNFYQKAIESAEEEKQQVLTKLKELDALKQRLLQLQTFIEQGKALLGLENTEDSHGGPSEPSQHTESSTVAPRVLRFSRGDSEMPNHMRIAKVIEEVGRAMTLNELVEEFKKRNWKLSKDNPRQVLRSCFNQHPEMFSQEIRRNGGIPRGYYSLRQ